MGKREPEVYGHSNFESVLVSLQKRFSNCELLYFQSNIEGELIDILHAEGFKADGIVINPGGYAHTSIALRDAISAIETPVIEVHISNVYQREDFRRVSLTAPVCKGFISGLGLIGYAGAVDALLEL